MKKLLSVILAIVMLASCAALSLQAFAAEEVDITRINVDFTCNPQSGIKVGSDYTISLSAATATGADATEGLKKTNCGKETQSDLISYGPAVGGYSSYPTYVVITKDDGEVVYPEISEIYYAPKRTNTVQDSDPNATWGNGSFYEAGSKYNYYLITNTRGTGYKFNSYRPDVYLNGKRTGNTEYHSDYYLVYFLGSRYVGKNINTIDITFSCNPENGAPVGSDYAIDVAVTADQAGDKELAVYGFDPLINEPDDGYTAHTYNTSLVAIYESNTLLYPGYFSWNITYAPAKKTTAQAHGSDPTGELGVGASNTPAFYETGKTYQYYATIRIVDENYYHLTDNTEVFVNGIKVTDFTKGSYGARLQIPLATVTCGHTHEMTFVPAVDPTYDSEGNVAYYHCEGCGKNYADEAGTQEIENVVLAKLQKPVVRPGRPSFIDRIRDFFVRIRDFFLRIFRR